TANVQAAKQALADRIITAFLSSAIPAGYQSTIRSFLSDDNFLLDELMGALFDPINRAIHDAVQDALGTGQDGVFHQVESARDALSSKIATAKVRGTPLFNGDSLRSIHLDADVKFNLPDPTTPFTFQAYMDIKELDSQTTPLSCLPGGDPVAEVTL